MASTGVNVLRWSALGFGVFYGIYHQSAITASDKLAAAQKEYQRKQHLIDEAKAAYLKKTAPATSSTSGSNLITDPENPKFDLEAYLTSAQAEAK